MLSVRQIAKKSKTVLTSPPPVGSFSSYFHAAVVSHGRLWFPGRRERSGQWLLSSPTPNMQRPCPNEEDGQHRNVSVTSGSEKHELEVCWLEKAAREGFSEVMTSALRPGHRRRGTFSLWKRQMLMSWGRKCPQEPQWARRSSSYSLGWEWLGGSAVRQGQAFGALLLFPGVMRSQLWLMFWM